MNKNLVKSVLTKLSTVLSIGLIGFVIFRSFNSLESNIHEILSVKFLLALFGALVLGTMGSLLLPFNFSRTLLVFQRNSITSIFSSIFSIYCKTQIFKYLPGNIFHFVGRQIALKQLGFTQLNIASTTLWEIVGLTLTSTLICFSFGSEEWVQLLSSKSLIPEGNNGQLVLMVFLSISIAWLIYFVRKKRDDFGFLKFVSTISVYALYFLATSAAFWLILYQLEIDTSFSQSAMIFTIAWLIGFVVPGASAGVGLREATILILGTYFLGSDLALAAIVLRIITVLADCLQWGLGHILQRNLTSPQNH